VNSCANGTHPPSLPDLAGQDIICKSEASPAFIQGDTERRAKQFEYKRRWAAKNRDKVRAAAARYRERHPDRCKKWKAAWNSKNKQKVNAYNRAWQKRNPDKFRAANRLWRYRYPELAREHERLRRMRKRARRMHAEGDASLRQLKALIFASIGKNCGYCGTILKRDSISLDHVVPLAKGGKNDMANINPVCRPCNLLKNTQLWPLRPPV
jgi:5-methylcytosine-specific restriction endonuclease McrA